MKEPMRKALLALVLTAVLAPVAAGASRAHVSLVTSATSYSVRGAQFQPGERVRVTLQLAGTRTKTVTAGPLGRFSAAFARTTDAACVAYAIRAIGSEGSRVTLRVMPECTGGPVNG